jgi:hypothetical protein
LGLLGQAGYQFDRLAVDAARERGKVLSHDAGGEQGAELSQRRSGIARGVDFMTLFIIGTASGDNIIISDTIISDTMI